MTSTLFTHSRTPSSDRVVNVVVSENAGSTWPVQRAEKVLGPMEGEGEPLPHSKLMVGSMRVTFVPVKSSLSQYSPWSPVPEPAEVMVNDAEATRLSVMPAAEAIARTVAFADRKS